MFSAKVLTTLGAAIGAVALASSAQAVTIISYDVTGAQASGFGGWAHTYGGTISGSGPLNYTGGSGTLNDGANGTSTNDTQLFQTSDGPTITAFLDSTATISTIDLLNGLFGNFIPGNITGVTVTIGSNSMAYSTTGFGAAETFTGFSQNQRVTLSGLLASTATSSFTLSNFVMQGDYRSYFSIGEIALDAQETSAVPESATWMMMIAGFGLAGSAMRYRRRKTSVLFA
jgi:hypothetical protein